MGYVLTELVPCFVAEIGLSGHKVLEMVEVAKDLATGTIGGAAQLIVGIPFDAIKVRLQSQPVPPPGQLPRYSGAIDAVKKKVHEIRLAIVLTVSRGSELVTRRRFAVRLYGGFWVSMMFLSPLGIRRKEQTKLVSPILELTVTSFEDWL
ncbi:mitochondrial carnitine/acylcarnitine carrier-like protein, partial [Tanacetum coccineum]